MRREKNEKKKAKTKIIILVVIVIISITSVVIGVNLKNKDKTEDVAQENVVEQNIVEEEPVEEEEPEEPIEYANEYERQVLEKSKKNNDYKVLRIDEDGLDGYMTVIYDPSRVKVAAVSTLGTVGKFINEISEEANALVAINGGGFVDKDFKSDGAEALGLTISNGVVKSSAQITTSRYGIIGFDKDNKLNFITQGTEEQAKSAGIRDGVTFGPILIKDGQKQSFTNFGGKSPRSAIAQREDGIVLFLTLDGDRSKGKGVTLDQVEKLLEKYSAKIAINLDGGTSTSMTLNNKIINNPTSLSGEKRTREIPTIFMLEKDKSDDGDYTVVEDKLK